MSQTKLFAASAAALIVACIAGWATADTSAHAATPPFGLTPSPP
jgi:hypothetical protein